MRILWGLVCPAALTCLAGCMMPYELPDGAPTAKLNIKSAQGAWICDGGSPHTLTADSSGYTVIAAGQRVVTGARFFASGYNVNYSCSPRVSFVPVAGASYYQDMQVEAERCTALIYREVDNNPVGLEFDPSMRNGGSCK